MGTASCRADWALWAPDHKPRLPRPAGRPKSAKALDPNFRHANCVRLSSMNARQTYEFRRFESRGSLSAHSLDQHRRGEALVHAVETRQSDHPPWPFCPSAAKASAPKDCVATIESAYHEVAANRERR